MYIKFTRHFSLLTTILNQLPQYDLERALKVDKILTIVNTNPNLLTNKEFIPNYRKTSKSNLETCRSTMPKIVKRNTSTHLKLLSHIGWCS